MSQEQKKEVSPGMAAEKIGLLAETKQISENALPSGSAEKFDEGTAQPMKNSQSGKKKFGILAIVVVVLAALAVGLGIYNKPENRLARQLDLGERYLEEQNYAEAVLAFEKAIQIDERCMPAYVNGIEAYRHLDEPENLLAFYERALGLARSLEGETLAADLDAVVSIYLAAEVVYTDRETLITLWEEGYERSGQDSRVRDSLVSVYLERAEERASDRAYEESLRDYDRLLELDGQNETVLESLTESLKSYLDLLLEEGNFDRIRELEKKYASSPPDFDFGYYLDEIDRLELEELCSQLELPFTAEDVTLFGYKLTEDHFDDIVHLLDLKKDNGVTDENGVPIDHWSRDGIHSLSSPVTAGIYNNGLREIGLGDDSARICYLTNQIYYVIDNNGLSWLQNHYPESYNLPLISFLGGKYEDWYRAVPAEIVQKLGEYSYEVKEDGSKKETWIVEAPFEVSFILYSNLVYSDNYDTCYSLHYGSFGIDIDIDNDGMIYRMQYTWSLDDSTRVLFIN